MKRLLITVAALVACAAFAAAVATGATSPSITVHSTPTAPVAGQTITVTSMVAGLEGAWVDLYVVKGGTCTATPPDEAYVDGGPADTGSFVYTTKLDTGTYAVSAYLFEPEGMWSIDSDCTLVTVGSAAPAKPSDELSSSYLCWNHEMVNPIAYVDKVADTMWKTGNYFEPQAILGNVAGGTNVGAYHLVCNAPSTMTPTTLGLGGSGEVYSSELTALYHRDHAGGNDLNLYHIWK